MVIFDNLVDPKAFICYYEMEEFVCHMKWQVLEVLNHFLSFLHTFLKNGHNVLALMLSVPNLSPCT
jgi:hypothetical protein